MFHEVKTRLKIIARATSKDKFVLIAGIKQKGGLVGMTSHLSDSQVIASQMPNPILII